MSKCGLQQPARRRLRVADLNPHLMCILCGGYYVDATTIIECLHSFCKSCLVRYLESNKYCPICEVQVHKTRPLQNIRPDETLQNMVYKLVPGLFQKEMQIRQEFYSKHPEAPESSPIDRGIVDPVECQFYSPEEAVSLALEFQSQASTSTSCNGVYKRYLRCPAAVTIAHLQKLVRNKFGLASHYDVEIMFLDKHLQPDLSIMDVAYAFQRKRKEQFHFTYRIVDSRCKKMRLDAPVLEADTSEPMEVDPAPPPVTPAISAASQSPPEGKSKLDSIISRLGIAKQTEEAHKKEKAPEEWKEVQLQISENGVMRVTDISSIDKLIDSVEKNISSVENCSNGKPLEALKTEPEEKKGEQIIEQEKPKMSVADSSALAKAPPSSISNGQDNVSRSLPHSEDKVLNQNMKRDDKKKAETPSAVCTSSKPNSSSLPKPVVANSSSSNCSSMRGVACSITTSSSTSIVFSVPSILSSSISAQRSGCSTSSASTVSVSAASTPISSVSSGSVPSGSISSTKVTPSCVSSVSAPTVSAASVSSPAACASTVSVSAVITPAVSVTSASLSSTKPGGVSCVVTTASSTLGTSSSTIQVTVVPTTASSSTSSTANVTSSCSSAVSTSSSKPANSTASTTASRGSPGSAPKHPSPVPVSTVSSKKSSSAPVGYKTLKCGPKSWNPTISRSSLLSSKMEQQQQQSEGSASGSGSGSGSSGSSTPGKQAAAPRFFKMRNTPRYLGNPASGVKAMYQVPESSSAPLSPSASSKTPSLMKLDPRTLTPIVSNASSPTVKSPTSQSKGRPPFPSTTLTMSSAQVNNHMASSRSVSTTTTTTSSANLPSMRSSPTSAQAQAMANFLNPYVPKGMPNFLYSALPSLLPSGPAQFANMLRPYPPYPAMLFQHHINRQLSVPPSPTSTSPPAVQRIPASGEKSLPSPSYRSNRSSESTKMNGQDSPKSSVAVKPKTSPRPATEPPYSPTLSKTSNTTLLPKESGRLSGGTTNDNNNTVPASKVKAHLEKSEGDRLSHNISKLLPKAITKQNESQVGVESKGAGVSSFQTPH